MPLSEQSPRARPFRQSETWRFMVREEPQKALVHLRAWAASGGSLIVRRRNSASTASDPMALYEYVCSDCCTSFELRRAMGDGDSAATRPSVGIRRCAGSSRSLCRWARRGNGRRTSPVRISRSRRVLWQGCAAAVTDSWLRSEHLARSACASAWLHCHPPARTPQPSDQRVYTRQGADGSPEEFGRWQLNGGG